MTNFFPTVGIPSGFFPGRKFAEPHYLKAGEKLSFAPPTQDQIDEYHRHVADHGEKMSEREEPKTVDPVAKSVAEQLEAIKRIVGSREDVADDVSQIVGSSVEAGRAIGALPTEQGDALVKWIVSIAGESSNLAIAAAGDSMNADDVAFRAHERAQRDAVRADLMAKIPELVAVFASAIGGIAGNANPAGRAAHVHDTHDEHGRRYEFSAQEMADQINAENDAKIIGDLAFRIVGKSHGLTIKRADLALVAQMMNVSVTDLINAADLDGGVLDPAYGSVPGDVGYESVTPIATSTETAATSAA